MIEAKIIQKYSKKDIPDLIKIAEKHFNSFIRERDRDGDYFFCPTCKTIKRIEGSNYHACHFFPAGQYPWHRFNENNVFGGCQQCNYYKHGAGYSFASWVREKIGEDEYLKLETTNAFYRRNGFKWDRYTLIEVILKYK